MKRLADTDFLKIAKITLGTAAAAAIAAALKLDYAVSAGIICLLTIQDTRKETLSVTAKRMIAFAVVTVLCAAVFTHFGYSLVSLAAVIALFLFVCMTFGMNEAIAMNSVIATHYFSSADCSLEMIMNEMMLLAAGAGTGILLNIFVPVNIRKIRCIQGQTDERIRQILSRMSVYILNEDRSDYTGSCFEESSKLLECLRTEAVRYIGNSFSSEKDYFYKYMLMRMEQCGILSRIYTDIIRLAPIEEYGRPISDFLIKMSVEFHEINDANSLLAEIDRLFRHYSTSPLPETRSEFESRALMYHILCDLKRFVQLKYDFAAGLSDKEKSIYWNSTDRNKGKLRKNT